LPDCPAYLSLFYMFVHMSCAFIFVLINDGNGDGEGIRSHNERGEH